MKTCTIDGCDTGLYAKGFCRTHYTRSRPRRPDAKVALPCDGCGTVVLKEKRTRRYATVQCSSWVCRVWLSFGVGWSEKLPADHWALNYGATCAWTPPKKPLVAEYNCEWCGKEATRTQAQAKFCTIECKRRNKRVRRRAAEFNAVGHYTWTDITRLWVTFDKACAYCAAPTALTDIQAEHVTALSVGGANNLSNLLPSCAACNSDKRELTLAAWATDRARRNLSPVKTAWDRTDARYSHLALEGQLEAA